MRNYSRIYFFKESIIPLLIATITLRPLFIGYKRKRFHFHEGKEIFIVQDSILWLLLRKSYWLLNEFKKKNQLYTRREGVLLLIEFYFFFFLLDRTIGEGIFKQKYQNASDLVTFQLIPWRCFFGNKWPKVIESEREITMQ